MTDHGLAEVRFRVAARGYDREDVDARLTEYQRGAQRAQARMSEIEAQVAEAEERAQTLEARLSQLEERDPGGPSQSVQWLRGVTEQILSVTTDDAQELLARMENEAKQEKEEADRVAGELLSAAQARAAQITGLARRNEETSARQRLEAHHQTELYIDQGKAEADERASALWNQAQVRVQEVQFELDRLEDARRAAAGELSHVQTTLEELERFLDHQKAPSA